MSEFRPPAAPRPPRVRPRRLFPLLAIWLFAPALAAIGGCASSDTTQHFIAEDPGSGERAIYRLRIDNAGVLSKYYFTAAYLPKVAIDLYEGKIPETLAELNAQSPDQESAAAKIQKALRDFLVDQAQAKRDRLKSLAPNADEQKLVDEATMYFSRLMARAMLSSADLQSVGEEGTLDPYKFRKLVYFASTKPLKIADFSGEVRDVENSLNSISTTLGTVARARGGEAASKQKVSQAQIDALAKLVDGLTPAALDAAKFKQVNAQMEEIK
jgi:hypothetical protein